MVGHFRKKKEKKRGRSGAASEGMFGISSTGLTITNATSMTHVVVLSYSFCLPLLAFMQFEVQDDWMC